MSKQGNPDLRRLRAQARELGVVLKHTLIPGLEPWPAAEVAAASVWLDAYLTDDHRGLPLPALVLGRYDPEEYRGLLSTIRGLGASVERVEQVMGVGLELHPRDAVVVLEPRVALGTREADYTSAYQRKPTSVPQAQAYGVRRHHTATSQKMLLFLPTVGYGWTADRTNRRKRDRPKRSGLCERGRCFAGADHEGLCWTITMPATPREVHLQPFVRHAPGRELDPAYAECLAARRVIDREIAAELPWLPPALVTANGIDKTQARRPHEDQPIRGEAQGHGCLRRGLVDVLRGTSNDRGSNLQMLTLHVDAGFRK